MSQSFSSGSSVRISVVRRMGDRDMVIITNTMDSIISALRIWVVKVNMEVS